MQDGQDKDIKGERIKAIGTTAKPTSDKKKKKLKVKDGTIEKNG